VNLQSSSIPTPPSSVWDRVSTWASENKAAVYTIAGLTVVISAGTIYYLSTPKETEEEITERRKAKKERKKQKKDADKVYKDVEKGPVEGKHTVDVDCELY
jgi:import receptor subunit TOM70